MPPKPPNNFDATAPKSFVFAKPGEATHIERWHNGAWEKGLKNNDLKVGDTIRISKGGTHRNYYTTPDGFTVILVIDKTVAPAGTCDIRVDGHAWISTAAH